MTFRIILVNIFLYKSYKNFPADLAQSDGQKPISVSLRQLYDYVNQPLAAGLALPTSLHLVAFPFDLYWGY